MHWQTGGRPLRVPSGLSVFLVLCDAIGDLLAVARDGDLLRAHRARIHIVDIPANATRMGDATPQRPPDSGDRLRCNGRRSAWKGHVAWSHG
jgi:hypothetical protein